MIKAAALLAFCGTLAACATSQTPSAQPAPASAAASQPASATPASTAGAKKQVCTNERDEEISSRIAVRRVCRPVKAKEPAPGS